MDFGKLSYDSVVPTPTVMSVMSDNSMGSPFLSRKPSMALTPIVPPPLPAEMNSVGMPMEVPSSGASMIANGSGRGWTDLGALLQHGASSTSLGAAAMHTRSARQEAATKLISNHDRLLMDVCNPSSTTNIDRVPLTQLELPRVDAGLAHHVDEGLREVARRLLGRGEPTPLHSAPEAVEARAACARYLHFRIQSHPEQKPGRTPDLSPEAAAAMKAVLVEVGSTLWEPLQAALDYRSGVAAPRASGAAAGFSAAAREEAATRLISNHFRLVVDVCNPTATTNADNIELGLTQLELVRVAPVCLRASAPTRDAPPPWPPLIRACARARACTDRPTRTTSTRACARWRAGCSGAARSAGSAHSPRRSRRAPRARATCTFASSRTPSRSRAARPTSRPRRPPR